MAQKIDKNLKMSEIISIKVLKIYLQINNKKK
jgi:hypothetical protein